MFYYDYFFREKQPGAYHILKKSALNQKKVRDYVFQGATRLIRIPQNHAAYVPSA